jgi:chromosome segregation ATPase
MVHAMKRCVISTSVAALLAVVALPAMAQTPPPKRAQVQADLANLLAQEIELKDQGKNNDARDRDTIEKNAALAKDIAAYDAEQARLMEDDRRYVSTATSHNAACGGTYKDKAHVEQCNARKRDLDAWQSAIVERDAALAKRHGELDARSKELQKEIDETARRKRENKAALEKVAKAIAAKREFIRVDDTFLNDPRKREQIGRNCAELPTVEQVKACSARPFGR